MVQQKRTFINNKQHNHLKRNAAKHSYLASETDVAEDGSLYPIIEYWSEEENPIIAIRIDSIFQIARIRFPEEYGLPFFYVLKNK